VTYFIIYVKWSVILLQYLIQTKVLVGKILILDKGEENKLMLQFILLLLIISTGVTGPKYCYNSICIH